uniref:Uncharacterized protein n=1 Tax=Anguilla anguilla TaxID=7936 RepID=A0A0E9U0T5_ANGAN
MCCTCVQFVLLRGDTYINVKLNLPYTEAHREATHQAGLQR